MTDSCDSVRLAKMPSQVSKSVLGFLFALVLGAATVPELAAVGLAKPWTVVIGWAVFLVTMSRQSRPVGTTR
jgi:hypothetical protein